MQRSVKKKKTNLEFFFFWYFDILRQSQSRTQHQGREPRTGLLTQETPLDK